MMTGSLFYFVSYVAAHKLNLKTPVREKLVRAWEAGLRPPSPEFFAAVPEFEPWRERGAAFWQKGADEISRFAERGTRFLAPEDEGFPAPLKSLPDPPWVLSVRGSLEALSASGLAVVGAREPIAGSLDWMQEHLGFVLKRAPLAVASGGGPGALIRWRTGCACATSGRHWCSCRRDSRIFIPKACASGCCRCSSAAALS